MGKPRIYGYARTSKDDQVLGLEGQRDQIEAKAAEMEAEGAGLFVRCRWEHESATKTPWNERDEFKKLCREMQRGDHLIVWRLDRIDRHPFRFIAAIDFLTRREIPLHVLELNGGLALDLTTAQGRVTAIILSLVADMMIEHMTLATKAALRRLRQQGYINSPKASMGKRKERVRLPRGEKTRTDRTYRHIEVWDEHECALIREVWVRSHILGHSDAQIGRDFHQRDERTPNRDRRSPSGDHWVRTYRHSKTGKKVLHYSRIKQAREFMDALIAEDKVPPELAINEEAVRAVIEKLASGDTSAA